METAMSDFFTSIVAMKSYIKEIGLRGTVSRESRKLSFRYHSDQTQLERLPNGGRLPVTQINILSE